MNELEIVHERYRKFMDMMSDNKGSLFIQEELKQSSDIILEILKNIAKKEYNISIVAPIKAGKSTFINALLGEDLMPNENEACTLAPIEVYLKPFKNKVIKILDNGATVVLKGSNVKTTLHEDVRTYRAKLNQKESIDLMKYQLNHELYFKSIDSDFCIKLVDTPGPNEFNMNGNGSYNIQSIFSQQLKESNFIIYVFDVQYYKTEENEKILRELIELKPYIQEEVIFIINKIDKYDETKGLDLNHVKFDVLKFLGELGFSEPKLFFVSSRLAMYGKSLEVACTKDENNIFKKVLATVDNSYVREYSKKISVAENYLSNHKEELLPYIDFESCELNGEELLIKPSNKQIAQQLKKKSNFNELDKFLVELLENIDQNYAGFLEKNYSHYKVKLDERINEFIGGINHQITNLKNHLIYSQVANFDKELSKLDNYINFINIDNMIISSKQDVLYELETRCSYKSRHFSNESLPYYNCEWYGHRDTSCFEETKASEYSKNLDNYFKSYIYRLKIELEEIVLDLSKVYFQEIIDAANLIRIELESVINSIYKTQNLNKKVQLVKTFKMESLQLQDVDYIDYCYIQYDVKSVAQTVGAFLWKEEVYYCKYRLINIPEYREHCRNACESLIADMSQALYDELKSHTYHMMKKYLRELLDEEIATLKDLRKGIAVLVRKNNDLINSLEELLEIVSKI